MQTDFPSLNAAGAAAKRSGQQRTGVRPRRAPIGGEWNTLSPEQKSARINTDIEQAIKEGTHSRTKQYLCQVGNHWCDSIFHLTFDRKGCCYACAIAKGLYVEPVGRTA